MREFVLFWASSEEEVVALKPRSRIDRNVTSTDTRHVCLLVSAQVTALANSSSLREISDRFIGFVMAKAKFSNLMAETC
jgi:hypothetical protein